MSAHVGERTEVTELRGDGASELIRVEVPGRPKFKKRETN